MHAYKFWEGFCKVQGGGGKSEIRDFGGGAWACFFELGGGFRMWRIDLGEESHGRWLLRNGESGLFVAAE